MIQANSSDTFIVNKGSVFSSEDDSYLLDLYAPIISLKNVSIYISLRNEIGNDPKELSSFFQKNQVTEGEFYNALEALEAIGLVKTYYLKKTENSSISFFLYCPRSPSEFFSNELLNGTLLKYTSKEYVEEMVTKYASPSKPEGYKDVSTKFMDYFQLDAEKGVYTSVNASLLGRKCSSIALSFDKRKFLTSLTERIGYNIEENVFSKEEYVKLARLTTLYGYDEETMASLLCGSSSYAFDKSKEYGQRIDFYRLSYLCKENEPLPYLHKKSGESSEMHGNDAISIVIREMDRLSSIDFLRKLQKGGKPASADQKIVDTLVMDMGLPENVTNALIFYITKIEGKTLSPNYVEKLGASLVREGCVTAIDALNFLGKTNNELKNATGKKKGGSKNYKPLEKKKITEESVKENKQFKNDEEVEDEDFDDFFNSL